VEPSDDGDLGVALDRCRSDRGASDRGAGRNCVFMAWCVTVVARRRVAQRVAPSGDGVPMRGP
jgi:hypothetical protein